MFFCDFNYLFYKYVKDAKTIKEFSISQKQAVIKLVEKKDTDKPYIKNWRPATLLDVDTKILSKALSVKLKEVFPTLMSSKKTAYVKNKFIGESGILISDIIDICDSKKFVVTMDIEKAFDILDHSFLILVLKKFGFGQNFIMWNETLLKDQKSCIINGGKTTPYFTLHMGAHQGDPISAFLFTLSLETLFLSSKKNQRFKELKYLTIAVSILHTLMTLHFS